MSERTAKSELQHPSGELELIEQIRAGDHSAYYKLIQPYEKKLYFAAISILKIPEDAEDAVQEALFKAFKALRLFRAESKFSTWLIQITTNEALMRLRKQKRAVVESLDEPRESEEGGYRPRDFADWREIPSDSLERKELRSALMHAIDALKPAYRIVLTLRDIEQLSVVETAKMLGLTEANVKIRLSRARLMLRDALAPGYDGAWSIGSAEYRKVRSW